MPAPTHTGTGSPCSCPVARDAGVASIIVSDERDAAVARPFFDEVLVGRLPRDSGALGAAAYGLDPDAAARPVLTLIGEVVAVKHVGADAGVSYGYSYRTSSPTTLALVALGYADGVPRLASNRATVRVGSGVHPLVGRVAMDQFVVDCGDDVPGARQRRRPVRRSRRPVRRARTSGRRRPSATRSI